jgi:hypothetical protein
MKRFLILLAFTAGVLALAGSVDAGKPKLLPKAFGVGCWKGKGTFANSKSVGPVQVTISHANLAFRLHVNALKAAKGVMTLKGLANAALPDGSSGKLAITGTFALFGKAGAVKAKGAYREKGTITIAGTAQPFDLKIPASGPLTIKSMTATTAAGRWGTAPWTAKKASC